MARRILLPRMLVFSLLVQAPLAYAQASAIGPGQEAMDLNTFITDHENDRAQSAEVARAMLRLAQLEDTQKHTEAARTVWKKAKIWFEKHHLPAIGGPEAQIAAEATLRLLDAQVAAGMDLRVRTTPGLGPQQAVAERATELESFLTHLLGKRPVGQNNPEVPRVGGLIGELEAVKPYGVLKETRQAAQTAGQILEHAVQTLSQLPIPEGLTAEDQSAQQQVVKKAIDELNARSFAVVEAAWLAGPDKKDPLAAGLRKTLNRLKPLKYPQADDAVEDTLAVTPEQAEASRFATLAQATKVPQLRVKYLEKAVKLDPQNPRYLDMLHQAKTDAGTP